MFSPSIALLEALEKKLRRNGGKAQPLQATRAAAFVNGVKARKGRATTKSGFTQFHNFKC